MLSLIIENWNLIFFFFSKDESICEFKSRTLRRNFLTSVCTNLQHFWVFIRHACVIFSCHIFFCRLFVFVYLLVFPLFFWKKFDLFSRVSKPNSTKLGIWQPWCMNLMTEWRRFQSIWVLAMDKQHWTCKICGFYYCIFHDI